MDFVALHAQAMAEVAAGGRGLRRWNSLQTKELISALTPSHLNFSQVLRLVALSQADRSFELPLTHLLSASLPPEQIVDLLDGVRKHVIQARLKDGDRLDHSILQPLENLLRNPHPEVIEWTLRTIEECGPQGVYFKSHLPRLRPSVFSLWRAQNRTILELVTLLERRWSPREPQKR